MEITPSDCPSEMSFLNLQAFVLDAPKRPFILVPFEITKASRPNNPDLGINEAASYDLAIDDIAPPSMKSRKN